MFRPQRIEPGPGQESVWDYPRPAIAQPSDKHVEIVYNGVTIADSHRPYRVLETSHPPTYYLPPEDVKLEYFQPTARRTLCEWKGAARYYTLQVGDQVLTEVAWSYPEPTPNFAALKDYIAVYPGRMEACYVNGERVQAQAGDFYGGWITSEIVGPFKGSAGTWGW
ncbi:MAG: DUF427 domain-containing protein [Spirulinaceae cyanobacterium RM2_2_10]|nr:DUF427 domain-containing protein [Spirulinaceae cyanobacterium SM2_1_0]NJO19800.1 DUF427 domain-containing protein [Spirulinaceae cyanobacterium RM2_2_10]